MQQKKPVDELKKIAQELRRDIVQMTTEAGSGHPTSSLSCIDILTCLYFSEMNYDPKRPDWPERDRFVMSKGHAVPAQYACLAKAGFFPKQELFSLRKINSRLQGHPDRVKTPGIEVSGGSLGQGLSVGNGMAMAGRLDKKNYRVYVLMGDGEQQEGQIWEAAMTAPNFKLDNVCGIIDLNGIQNDEWVEKEKSIQPLVDKWRSFNWHVIEINGHDIPQILSALEQARKTKGRPTVIIAKTVKGKGVSFISDNPDMHGVAVKKEDLEKALAEIGDKK
ncbi:MAG: transketolase [Candidatus Diapherotrites archaeon]|nr:transketolase [Candidatus Diapherotrites archaeon]